MFDSYSELQDKVKDWLNREDLGARIPDFIFLAELDAQREMRVRTRDAVATGNFVADQDYIDLPTDLLEPRYLRIDTDPTRRVNIVSIDKFEDVAAKKRTSQPDAAFQHGSKLYLARTPQDTTAYTLFYVSGIPHLSTAVPTNFLLRHAPDFLLYASLVHAAPYLGADERTAEWKERYGIAKEEIRRQEWRSKLGGGPLAIRPSSLPPRLGGVRGSR